MTPPDERTERRVQRVLERKLAAIDSPETAEAVVERIEQIGAKQSEQAAADQVKEDPRTAAEAVSRAARARKPEAAVARVLAETAAQAVAPTPEAPAVQQAVEKVVGPPRVAESPEDARRGQRLLEGAVLRRMRRWDRLDARLFIWVNGGTHPRWLDRAADGITEVFRGGWVWAIGVFLAWLLGVPRSGRALALLLPSLAGATLTVDYPVKAFFRRRRPFIHLIRAVVVGQKPGSWSFPSGHTASSFAAAWVLSTIWPRGAPGFVALASLVGASRVYAGAHYPGDVLSGALAGTFLAELVRGRIACLVPNATGPADCPEAGQKARAARRSSWRARR